MKLGTRLVQRGRHAKSHPGTVNLPVARASTVTFATLAQMRSAQASFDADEAVPTYGIANMPLRAAFEELMVEIDAAPPPVPLPSRPPPPALALFPRPQPA